MQGQREDERELPGSDYGSRKHCAAYFCVRLYDFPDISGKQYPGVGFESTGQPDFFFDSVCFYGGHLNPLYYFIKKKKKQNGR